MQKRRYDDPVLGGKQKTEKKTQQEQAQEYHEKHGQGELEKLPEELIDDEMKNRKRRNPKI